jgi:hypothetical protein
VFSCRKTEIRRGAGFAPERISAAVILPSPGTPLVRGSLIDPHTPAWRQVQSLVPVSGAKP